jgi:hypothetical protein
MYALPLGIRLEELHRLSLHLEGLGGSSDVLIRTLVFGLIYSEISTRELT